MKKGNSVFPTFYLKMLKHAVCHLLMDWMFQYLLYKHRTVEIDKQLLASPLRRLTSHHIPIIVCLFWGLTWELLGSYLENIMYILR